MQDSNESLRGAMQSTIESFKKKEEQATKADEPKATFKIQALPTGEISITPSVPQGKAPATVTLDIDPPAGVAFSMPQVWWLANRLLIFLEQVGYVPEVGRNSVDSELYRGLSPEEEARQKAAALAEANQPSGGQK